MSEELEKSSNIVSKADLGEGRKQITFSVNPDSLNQYMDMFKDLDNVKISDERLDYKLGKGSVLNRYEGGGRYSRNYTSNDTPYTTVYNDLPKDPHRKIKLAVELYYKEPIVGSVIDMMVDFSSSGFTNECDDLEIKKIFDKWSEELNINELLEKIFLEYYRSGNVTIYRSKSSSRVKRKKRKASTNVDIDIQEYDFPSAYTVLNPMNVFINGTLLFDKPLIQLKVSEELQSFLTSQDASSNYLTGIPDDIIRDVRSGSGFVTLNPDYTSRITRKKMDYERYASPFLERVFEPIMYKAKLRTMDMSTIEGLVNQLVTVTVGDKDYPADDDDLTAIAELFQTPNKAYTVFWNHTLKVTFHKPEGIDTLNGDKYKQVNEDIMAGLGVSRVLLDGSGGQNFSSAWVSILTLIERLDNARNKVKYWIEAEYARIARENGFKTYPRVRFNKMNLREDTYIRDVLLAMYDRGLIDEEDILLETGRDYQSVIDMKKRNEKNAELFFPPEQPFQGGQSGPNNPNNTGSPGGKQKTKRKTNPQNNSGKTPKVRKATASYDEAEEDYANELIEQYDLIQSEIAGIIQRNQNEDDRVKQVLITSTVLSLFRTFSSIGNKYITQLFNDELSEYTDVVQSRRSTALKEELKSWNDSYVVKLSNDIIDDITKSISSGQSISNAVSNVFQSNRYRVALFSQAGVLETVRQAQIVGNEFIGRSTATWITHLDDRTCATCRGLHGRAFATAEVPPRPHSGCRCTLEFE